MDHGITYESYARNQFENDYNVTVNRKGLIITETYPYLGCSPDGIFKFTNANIFDNHFDLQDDNLDTNYLIEIKCPWNGKDYTLQGFKDDK